MALHDAPMKRLRRSSRTTRRAILAWSALVAVVAGTAALSERAGAATGHAPALEADGIGTVRFGLPKTTAVAELSNLFGDPSARFVNSGCGARYTEVAWGELYAEFRLDKFSGYRYLPNGWPPRSYAHRPAPPKVVSPRIATARGITLGSTLAQVKAAYRPLKHIATDGWQAANRLVFVDDARHDPIPPTSRIIEIKIGTCGDY
jgi:hypothetical protein